MIAALRRCATGTIVVLGLFAAVAGAEQRAYAGRPVVDVLLELRDAGFDFIYSSELLPSSLRVLAEPRATNRLLIAREILSAHGLALSAVRPGLFAVVPKARRGFKRPVDGQVTDATDGQPVAGARVVLQPIGAIDWTNSEGRFSFKSVLQGSYRLQVEATGYQPAELGGVVVSQEGATADVSLTPGRMALATVVVSTSRYAFERANGLDAIHVGGESLANQPEIGEDAIRALGRLPGIAQSGVSAQSAIRGGETGETLTLLDGFPLRQAYHMPGYQSVFGVLDPGLIDDAEIYTGGFPVRYGNRMGGVFDLHTIAAADEPRTALGLSVFNAMARRGGRLAGAPVDWLAAGRVGTLDPFVDAFAQSAGKPTYADAYARAGFGEPDRLRVTANLLWSRDKLAIERERQGEVARIESRSRYLWLRAERDWRNGVQASLWLGYSGIESDREGTLDLPGSASGSVDDHRSADYREARARITWQPRSAHWLEGGLEWTDEEGRYRYAADAQYADPVADLFARAPTLARAASLDPGRERVALFGTHRWRIARDWITELGLRAQRTITEGSTSEHWLYDPRANLRWQVTPSTSLRAHWGRFHQTDEVHELKVEDGLLAFPEPQRSDHVIIGLDHRLRGGLGLRVEWFEKHQSDPRPRFENQLDPLSLMPEIAADRVMIAPDSAEIHGLEFSVVERRRERSWWASLAWSQARDLVDDRRVARSWDQTWAATAGLDWTHGKWRFGAIAGVHRGWPTTQVSGTSLGARNAARFPTRASLDLRAQYQRPLTTGSLAVTFELTNAVNVGNRCCSRLIAADDGAGGVTFTTRRSDWLPIVPSVGMLWAF